MEFNEEINKKGEKKIEYWREYLKRTKMNVFDVIDEVIMLAALDYPNDYRVKKAKIAELLFSCKLTRCINCNHDDNHDDHDDHDGDDNISYGEIEALNDLIEEEKEIINEVLRIKDLFYNSQDESDKVLFESLRRLQLMHLSINVLKETEIGKAVNHIKKHTSQNVRHLARSLIAEWKIIVDEWMKSTQEITGVRFSCQFS